MVTAHYTVNVADFSFDQIVAIIAHNMVDKSEYSL
jgi:hypothetical protein